MEADISGAEARAEKAETEGNAGELRRWRMKKMQLRNEKHELRDKELCILRARAEIQQQGTTLCPPLKQLLLYSKSSQSKTFRQHQDVNMLPPSSAAAEWVEK